MNGEGRLVRPRLRFERDFTQLPNTWMRDEALSWKARGLLAFLMTHSEGWSVTIKSLATSGPDGRAAIQTAIQELEEAGYLQRQQTRDGRGRLGHVWWEISDPAERVDYRGTPLLGFPSTDNQPTVYPDADYPSAENRPTVEEQVKEHLPRSLKSPTIDARGGKKDDLAGDNHQVATESPAERYSRLIAEKCPTRPGRQHDWEASGYCTHCGARQPSATVELAEVTT